MSWTKYLSAKRLRETKRDYTNDPRNEFESDFGRVIFSPAIRRMHDKTQVFPLDRNDSVRTRLTHSHEVSTLARSIGLRLVYEKEKIFVDYNFATMDNCIGINTNAVNELLNILTYNEFRFLMFMSQYIKGNINLLYYSLSKLGKPSDTKEIFQWQLRRRK